MVYTKLAQCGQGSRDPGGQRERVGVGGRVDVNKAPLWPLVSPAVGTMSHNKVLLAASGGANVSTRRCKCARVCTCPCPGGPNSSVGAQKGCSHVRTRPAVGLPGLPPPRPLSRIKTGILPVLRGSGLIDPRRAGEGRGGQGANKRASHWRRPQVHAPVGGRHSRAGPNVSCIPATVPQSPTGPRSGLDNRSWQRRVETRVGGPEGSSRLARLLHLHPGSPGSAPLPGIPPG